jgi:hypothetical protein
MPLSYLPLPTKRLQELLVYCPETGQFRWTAVARPRVKSRPAGTYDRGYIIFRIDKQKVYAHRAAWYLHYGQDPLEKQIDHINCNKSDNRICNLRLASHADNQINKTIRSDNTSGYKGVSWWEARQKWVAKVCVNGKHKTVGYFDSAEDAAIAAQTAREKLHGNFANHG